MKVRVVKDHFCGTGWRAEPETLYLGGVGAVYVEKLEFVLPETWAGMAVTLPIDNAQLEQMISTGFTVGAALAAWWKNNSFTQAALAGDEEYERAKKRVMK